LDAGCASSRMFPAVDIAATRTKRDDLLLASDEAAAIAGIRKSLGSLDTSAALNVALEAMKKSSSNVEFLVAMGKQASTSN